MTSCADAARAGAQVSGEGTGASEQNDEIEGSRRNARSVVLFLQSRRSATAALIIAVLLIAALRIVRTIAALFGIPGIATMLAIACVATRLVRRRSRGAFDTLWWSRRRRNGLLGGAR